MGHMRDANLANLAAMEQSRMLAQTLGQNRDPKFQVYEFQFRYKSCWLWHFSSISLLFNIRLFF